MKNVKQANNEMNFILSKLDEYNALKKHLQDFMEPKLYVCTQTNKHVLAVYDFYAINENSDNYIFAAHNSNENFNIIGLYNGKERAKEVYEDMLKHSITKKYLIYEMPKE